MRTRGGLWPYVAVSAALLAAGALLLVPGHDPTPAPPAGPTRLGDAWPSASVTDLPALLPDGAVYSPALFLDPATSIGTAPSDDGRFQRLVRRAPDGTVTELRRLAREGTPQFGGFVTDGTTLAWAESTADAEGHGRTEMWTAPLSGAAGPRRLTADTGDVVFFVSEYDMVVDGGRLHWLAVSADEGSTELRSVPLTGGAVSVRREPGQWARSRWPWLVSAGSGETGSVQVRDERAGRTTEVATSASEIVTCSPSWCRVQVIDSTGPTRIDLMRPDGGERHRMAGGTASAALIDVAVLDRFEVLGQTGAGPESSNQQLYLYDVRDRRTVLVAEGVGLVAYRAGHLWWSTGLDSYTVWHTLDLRTLS